jgi:hypothetical protein
MSDDAAAAVIGVIASIAVGAFATLVATLAVQYGWNLFASDLLGAPRAGVWNAFGLIVLVSAGTWPLQFPRIEKK